MFTARDTWLTEGKMLLGSYWQRWGTLSGSFGKNTILILSNLIIIISTRVDIGTAEPASLSYLAFEGATKRNRPNVNVGDIVYAKLLVASSHTEAELVCVDSYGKKAGMGVLTGGGFMFSVPLNLVRKLLSPDCNLLTKLGECSPFEIAVGVNGRVWLRARSVKETMLLAQGVTSAEYMTNQEISLMCDKLADILAGF